ncbi:MAG: hypothetical protein KJ050_03165 [Candidatus Omnitrophica bacterium]|nr:hypothetical protein [bacterium]MBK7495268.1 hypothetical protein [Candidatus Omnitrophota bacterium]MCE7909598.1 hypothetical protein [Candidatus Omnitrophica bacterium COP1]MBV6483508.1 hypothetical protein [bacterium]MBW7938869.1 hypothetical protein [Candidatus Omnitrophota bacterium]
METGEKMNPKLTETLESGDVESFGWSFHKWPFLIALVIVVLLYALIFAFVDPNPPYFDPASLPPPPPGK